MKPILTILVIMLVSLSPVSSTDEGNNGVATFSLHEDSPIYLSFETYKSKDGWTPVVLSLQGLNIRLWMDDSGSVSETRRSGDIGFIPVCSIDLLNQSLVKGSRCLEFKVYEDNPVRTRWILSTQRTSVVIPKQIHLKSNNGVDLNMGNIRLQMSQLSWKFHEISPGLSQVQFNGPRVYGHQSLVYEKASGNIYTTKLSPNTSWSIPEKGRIWARQDQRR